MISWKISLKIKSSKRISISTMFLKKSKSISYGSIIENLDWSWVRRIVPGGFSRGWFKSNSGVCRKNCSSAGTNIEFYFLLLLALTISPQQSRQMLWEDSELLQKNCKNLFGKKFLENICHTSKSKKQTLEIGNLANLGKLVEKKNLVQKSGISLLVPVEDLKHIHTYIRSLFCGRKISNL